MKAPVQKWIDFAAVDLMAAKRLLGDIMLTGTVCFHSQQCVEKCLKAVIEFKEIIPPKTHDLIRLYGIIEEWLKLDEDMLARLNEVYIDSRYPSSIGFLPDGLPTHEEAQEFCEYAEALLQMITNFISE